jgi:hypothetical protein
MRISRKAWLLFLACAAAPSASAEAPVAIVEDVKGQVAGLEVMDYLSRGRTIRLAPDDAVVIGYLGSCVREAIRGGTIEIGETESKVESGVVERGRVECDARRMVGAPGVVLESTGFISREPGGESLPSVPRAPPPEFILYGASPLVELNGAGPLVIARLDKQGEYFRWDIDPAKLSRGRFLDLAAEGKALTPGGVYAGRWQNRLVVFEVDPSAKAGETPLLGRLLRLGFSP